MKSSTQCFIATIFVALVTSSFAAVAQAATSTCRDEAGPGGSPGNWVATYNVDNTPGGPQIKFTSLGFREDGSALTQTYDSFAGSSGKQWILRWDGNPNGLRGDTQAIMASTPGAFQLPRLTTPNKRCSLQIAPYALSPPTGPKVAIIGDSLVAMYTRSTQERQKIANHMARTFGWRFHVDAVAGRLLSSSLPDRVGGGGGMKEIQGVLATRPNALVIALSVNDALANAVTMDCSEGIHPYPQTCQDPIYAWVSRTQRTINFQTMLKEVAALAARENVCVVFVTPQTDHVDATIQSRYLLASARNYQQEASRLRQYILQYDGIFQQQYPRARIGYMDWANVVNGRDYRLDDNLHLNAAGQLVHLASWLTAVRSTCAI